MALSHGNGNGINKLQATQKKLRWCESIGVDK